MTRRGRTALKVLVWAACLAPLAWLGRRAWVGDLGANPISFITNTLGDWTFRILLASLAVTPLRLLSGWSWPITLRRLLGLFAFLYASLHFGVWLVLDHYFDWREMGADIAKRPYITVGMAALLLLIPLAATSTSAMMGGIQIYAFAAATLGGFGSPVGAVVGGFLVGVVENLVGTYVSFIGTELKLTVALAMIMVVLLVKPSGLFGRTHVRRV